MKPVKKQASEWYIVGILLAFAGGYLDVYTYVCRGGVFANAQTGNIVLLAINAAQGNFDKVFLYLCPILAFMAGIAMTEEVRIRFKKNTVLHWRQIVIALEFLVLWSIAFVPTGKYDDVVNIAVAFVCSLQVESFRTFGGGSSYATTMCTGNLRTATEHLFYSRVNKDKEARNKSLQYYGIIFTFIVGATVGMFVTTAYEVKSVLVVCLILLSVFVIMFIPNEKA